MTFLYPMRPGLTVPDTEAGREMLPKDWWYQPKLDDERAMIDTDGEVFTRFGKRFDKVKLAKFKPAISELLENLPHKFLGTGTWLDVSLIGYRKTRASFKVVLLDMPARTLAYSTRNVLWQHLPEFVADDHNLACRIFDFSDPVLAVRLATAMGHQCEGIIGRNPYAPYQSGDSDNMLKMRFKR